MTEPAASPALPNCRATVIFAGEVDHDSNRIPCTLERGFSGTDRTNGARPGAVLYGEEPGAADNGAGTGAPVFLGPAGYKNLEPQFPPPHGIPAAVFAAASRCSLARSAEHRDALARLEVGLLYGGPARVRNEADAEKRERRPVYWGKDANGKPRKLPRRVARPVLPEHRFRSIRAEKVARGEWFELKPVYRYTKASGERRTLPGILALTPRYALELINQDNGERFTSFSDYTAGRRIPPRVRTIENIPPDIAAYLEAGTGLVPDHAAALRVFYAGGELYGWRLLVQEPPGRELRPSWSGKDCGRFYTSQPALQLLPKAYRLAALSPVIGGEGFAELDFKCCQPNIAAILAGIAPGPDLYAELAAIAGREREDVKQMVLPILHGRTRAHHVYLHGPRFAGIYDTILRTLHAPGDELHRLESEILRGVLRRMAAAGMPRPGLPVHDSVLTTEPRAVAVFMREESERVLGRPLQFHVSQAGPGLLPL